MFELLTVTETELTSFVGRTQKSGPEDVPAVSFRLRLTGVDNAVLDMFSKTLRAGIYMAVPGQEDLPGVEPSTPLLRSKDVTHLSPDFRYEGWSVAVARGLNDDALQMRQCKCDDFNFDFHEGGRFDYDFRVSTADVDEAGAGMLWGRQKRKVFVRIEAPELPAEAIDGTQAAFDRDHPELAAARHNEPNATDLFAAGDDPDAEQEARLDALHEAGGCSADEGPDDDAPADLEDQLRKSIDAAGLKPKRGRRAVGAV